MMMLYFQCCGTSSALLQIQPVISNNFHHRAGSLLREILRSSTESPSCNTAFPFTKYNEQMIYICHLPHNELNSKRYFGATNQVLYMLLIAHEYRA